MSTPAASPITFNRVVSPALEGALSPAGELSWLFQLLTAVGPLLDVQLRADRTRSWASAYLGLTKVLDIIEAGGKFRLDVADKHADEAKFDKAWKDPQPAASLTAQRAAIEAYLTRVLADGAVDPRYTGREGRVQSLLSNATHPTFGVVQREAVPAFASVAVRDQHTAPLQQRMWAAVARDDSSPDWWPTQRNHQEAQPRLGLEADALGWDDAGRLLVIEVKPADAIEGIAWAPAQARMYAEVFSLWLDVDPHARMSLTEMAAQRIRLGLPAPTWPLPPQQDMQVVPVIAIGDGSMSSQALRRLSAVHAALQTAPSPSARMQPLEVWRLDDTGHCTETRRPDHDEGST